MYAISWGSVIMISGLPFLFTNFPNIFHISSKEAAIFMLLISAFFLAALIASSTDSIPITLAAPEIYCAIVPVPV